MRPSVFLAIFFLMGCHDPRQVTRSGSGAFEPSLAIQNDEVIIAWHDDRMGQDEIFLTRLNGQLDSVAGEFRLTNTNDYSYEADVASMGNNIAVAWYDKDLDDGLAVKLGLWDRDLRPIWIKTSQ